MSKRLQTLNSAEVVEKREHSYYDFEEKRLSKAFLDLPVKRREIMELLFFEGLNEKETARRLNCSIQHVKNQRCIAIKKLRAVLKEDTNEKI